MKEVHMICNAHIDPIWQWEWSEGVSAVLSTFSTAVKLAEKYDYVFCHNEVTVYKYVEDYAPDLFKKIQELVSLGKWHIMGGWYLQPDCNMPRGESFVRQIREGQRYFKEKFGVCPTTAINFDPFGHSVGLVQIIKKCGQDSYIFMRPYARELTLPSEQFIWRGLDGSEIKAARAASYNSHLGRSAKTIKERADAQDFSTCLVLWGVGNHGGGPSDKDLADIERELIFDTDTRYIHSTPERFFEKIEPTEVFDQSLRISMPGCYTSMQSIKRLHAKLENELYFAEKIASTAYARGLLDKYPENELRCATEDLLNAEFHDVLPGTSVESGEESGLGYLYHGILEAERVKVKAYFALAKSEMPAGEGEYPIVVFNPRPYEYTDNVECEFMLADQNWAEDIESKIRIVDENGHSVPYQLIKEESNLNLDWRKRVIFEAKLKPLALTRFSVYVDFVKKESSDTIESFVFDNGRKHVEIDSSTGLLKSYRIGEKEYLKDGFGLVSFSDNADPWGMGRHQLERLGCDERTFKLSDTPSGVFEGMKSIQVIENGDIYLGIEAFFEDASTKARIIYKIYKNNDAVDIDVNVFMGDIDRIIKLKLPFACSGELIGGTAFGTEKLFMDARENVSQRFVGLDTGEDVIALLNNGVYGSHFENGALYTSLIRGITYCAHPIMARPLIPNDRFTKKIDQGCSSFSFRIIPTNKNNLERCADEFCEKPYAENIFPIPSEALCERNFDVKLGDSTTCLVAMKKMDKADAIIFRLHNNTDKAASTYISVNGVKLDLEFTKYEVKTVTYQNGMLSESYELMI